MSGTPPVEPVPVDVRALPGADRDLTAEGRDLASSLRDVAANERDDSAVERDGRARAREEESGRTDLASASDRAAAKRDRQASENDRVDARHDREAAAFDRGFSAHERSALLIDELTGSYRREVGLMELDREIVKATRTGQTFVLAFIDVDHLKRTNDTEGHNAGDLLLRHVAQTVRSEVRPYDPVVRYGGDEFLCGMLGLDLAAAGKRFAAVDAALADADHASVSTGLVELRPGESLRDLVLRADGAMYEARSNKVDE